MFGRRAVAIIAVHQHVHRILELCARDVSADLAERNRKQIQLLEAQRFVGGHQHPSALIQVDQMVLCGHGGLGKHRAFGHRLQRFVVVRRFRGKGPVVHAGDVGHGRHQIRQQVRLLHPLAHSARYIFREQGRGVARLEKFLHQVRARARSRGCQSVLSWRWYASRPSSGVPR